MASVNQVMLIGNVTRDPQTKQLPGGGTVTDFGLAMNRKRKSSTGEEKEEVCYVDCTAFGKQAEVLAQYVTKGKPLYVQGRLKLDQWEDKAGAKRSKLTVTIEQFQFLNEGKGGGEGSQDRQQAARPQSQGRQPARAAADPFDDAPF